MITIEWTAGRNHEAREVRGTQDAMEMIRNLKADKGVDFIRGDFGSYVEVHRRTGPDGEWEETIFDQ